MRRIDVHQHVLPPGLHVLAEVEGQPRSRPPRTATAEPRARHRPDGHLRRRNRSAVPDHPRHLAGCRSRGGCHGRQVNECGADLVEDRPDRFGYFVTSRTVRARAAAVRRGFPSRHHPARRPTCSCTASRAATPTEDHPVPRGRSPPLCRSPDHRGPGHRDRPRLRGDPRGPAQLLVRHRPVWQTLSIAQPAGLRPPRPDGLRNRLALRTRDSPSFYSPATTTAVPASTPAATTPSTGTTPMRCSPASPEPSPCPWPRAATPTEYP